MRRLSCISLSLIFFAGCGEDLGGAQISQGNLGATCAGGNCVVGEQAASEASAGPPAPSTLPEAVAVPQTAESMPQNAGGADTSHVGGSAEGTSASSAPPTGNTPGDIDPTAPTGLQPGDVEPSDMRPSVPQPSVPQPSVPQPNGGGEVEGEADPSEQACEPLCLERMCGDDGCGGDCGACPRGAECEAGMCPNYAEVNMVLIHGGTYNMGAEDLPDSSPVHSVTVQSFWLDDTEVTAGAYRECVEAGDCEEPGIGGKYSFGPVGKFTHPANDIPWPFAKAYCERLGKRLPTEAEWEYAAGGSEDTLYSWGNEAPAKQLCWWDTSNDTTCPVATFPAGAHGLYDMTGGVWEWTSTEWCPYSATTDSGYEEGCDTGRYIDRGGGWSNEDGSWIRRSRRNGFKPEKRTYLLGFRCARDAD